MIASLRWRGGYFFPWYRSPRWVWLVIYAILPIGLPVIWVRNRDADPGVEPGEQLLPRWLGRSFGVVGIVIGAFALAPFAVPGTVGRLWPWSLTPLMAQVVAGG